ncbi:MAG: hypothetical protein KKF95_03265 [Nanoarchaeota archaeon]|nr:hypothetical protein [Nanoarchaeota archaeon]
MQNYTIKYYSVDAGGNAQATKSNIIKIDNILANLTMTLKKNGAIVSEVGYGDYVIDVASDKPIAAITKFELKKPAAFTDNVNAVIKTVDMGISATYIIPNNATSSKPKDKAFYNNNDGPLKFEVWIIDSHRLASSKTFNYTFDTRRPGTPTLDPIFKETNEEGYPFKYSYNSITLEDGTVYPAKTYFVRDSQLFVTGTTELSTNLGLVSLYLLKSEDPGLYQTNLKYNQTKQSNKGSAIETDSKQTTSDFSADKGATQIKLQGQHPNWAAGKYITFSKDVGRTTYNHFGKFYRITNNEFFGPQNQETRITFTPGLETSVGSNRDVYLYNESHMIYWFGINMNTDYKNPPDNNSYFLRAGLQNKNDFSALTISYNFFFDNKKPDIHLVTPAFGETLVNELQPLSIEIREDVVGSGVNKDTVNLSIKYNDGVESVYRVDTNGLLLSYVGVENNERRYQLNYTPSSPWGHGNYTIKLFLEDYAGNSYDDHGLLKSCYPSKDGCCNDAEDSVCDPDCGQDADGSYIFGKSDPDCPTNCNSTSGNCCLLLTDNICDDDCYDTWDVDCRCSIPGACDTTNNTWCYQGGWINKTSDGSKKYCDLDVCGNEDPDCFDCDKDHEGACNTLNNTWCHNVSGGYYWITEGYNLQCGPVDSDCLRLYTYTACTQNSCDVENQKVCSNSYWTNQNYSGLCKRNDFSFYECFAGDCDLFNNYVCLNTNSWTNSNYCSNYMCNTKDYNCYSTTNTCVNGVCNTDVEYYCSNNAWINTTTTYKTNCGSKDYDYGCPVCIDEKCDIDNNVWCVNDVWTDNYYCDVNACQGQDSDCGSLCSGGLTPDNCCNPSGFNVCDPDCTELQDSDCHGCTAAQGDCCVPLDDDKCDPDCTVIPDPNCAPGWVFNVDKDAPSKPNITMYGANMQIDPSNRTVVNNAPQRFELDYTRRNNGSIETLNLTTPIVEMLTPANIGVTCQNTSLRNVFSCTFNKTLTEGLYTFNTSARKYLQNGSLGGRGVHLFTVFVDLNAPQFNLTKSTSFIKPNQQLTLFANVTNTEYDLIAEITVAGQQFSLNSSYRTGSVYQFVTPADLNWGSEGEKTILFILKDYADRSTQKTTSVTVDNSTPDITITNIISEMIIITNQTNATVGTNDTNTAQLNVTIFGIVSENTKTLCYYQVGEGGVPECLLRCSIAGAGDNCIDENNQFEFQIIMNVVGEYSQEIWKTAILSAENYVGLTYSSSLYLLLDLAAPTPPDISIASS